MKTLFVVVIALIVSVSVLCAQLTEEKAEPAKAPDAVKTPVKATMIGNIAVKTIPATLAATVMEKAAAYEPQGGYKTGMEGIGDAYQVMMTHGFEKLGAWIHAGGKVMGPPLAFYYEDPIKTPAKDLTCKICFPTDTSAKGNDVVTIATLPEEKCAVVQYKGPYESSDNVWTALEKWIPEHNLVPAGPPSEVYFKGVGDNVPPEEFVTEIRQPVKTAEAKKEEPKK